MGSSTEKLKDKWFRLIGIPLVALVANVLFFYDKAHNSGYFFCSGICILFFMPGYCGKQPGR